MKNNKPQFRLDNILGNFDGIPKLESSFNIKSTNIDYKEKTFCSCWGDEDSRKKGNSESSCGCDPHCKCDVVERCRDCNCHVECYCYSDCSCNDYSRCDCESDCFMYGDISSNSSGAGGSG